MHSYIDDEGYIVFERNIGIPRNEQIPFILTNNRAIIVYFGRRRKRNGKNPDHDIIFCAAAFSLEYMTEEEAQDIMSSIEFRYATRKYSWNRSVPVCEDIIDFGSGEYILVMQKNSGRKMLLHEQVKMFDEQNRMLNTAESHPADTGFIPEKMQDGSLEDAVSKILGNPDIVRDKTNITDDEWVLILHILSAQSLTMTFSDNDLAAFYDYWMSETSGRENLPDKIRADFPETPRILRLAMDAEDNILFTAANQADAVIDDEQMDNIEIITEALSVIDGDQLIMTPVVPDDNGRHIAPVFCSCGSAEYIKALLLVCTALSGSLIVRIVRSGKKDQVYGFVGVNQAIVPIDAETLRKSCGENPDGTFSNLSDREEYFCVKLPFAAKGRRA